MSSEGGMELEVQETEVETEVAQHAEKNNKKITVEGGGGAAAAAADASSAVRWERFLPKMVVRVLLVEADDSTRQIISALLRKCSYKGWVSSSNHCWDLCVFGFEKLRILIISGI